MKAPGGTAKKNEGPMRTLMLMLTAMALVGCTAQPLPRHAQFNQEEYTSYGGFGTGIIDGEAFLTTRGGDVKKAAAGNSFRYIGSDQATLTQITNALGDVIGKPALPYVQFSDENALKGYLQMGLNEGMAASLVQLGRATREGKMIAGYLANPPAFQGAVKLPQFAKEFAHIYSAH